MKITFDALNNLAQDKALHAIGGSVLSAAAMSVLVLAGKPQYASPSRRLHEPR